MVHGRGCNQHRSLWRHNSETIRDREKRRSPRPMKSSELSNGENRIALRQLLQNRKLRHLWRHNLSSSKGHEHDYSAYASLSSMAPFHFTFFSKRTSYSANSAVSFSKSCEWLVQTNFKDIMLNSSLLSVRYSSDRTLVGCNSHTANNGVHINSS